MNGGCPTIDPEIEKITSSILSSAFEVSNQLGHGFLERVYRAALKRELEIRHISASEEVPFSISYKGESLGTYVADLVVMDLIVVELKAVASLAPSHVGQTLNYLKASGLSVGLLLNFGRPKLEYRRVLL